MKIIDYKIVKNLSSQALAEEIADLLREGWQPLGGVSLSSKTHQYLQAMVRYEDTK